MIHESQMPPEAKKWKTIYPAYINGKYTIEQGRRVPQSKGVDMPKLQEISEVLGFLKLHHVIEMDKAYSRDWINPGRFKVMLKTPEGKLLNPEIPSKRVLLLKLCEYIPRLKSRASGGGNKAEPTESTIGGENKKKKKKP